MAVYTNRNHASPLTGVEFTPVSDGNFTFFYIDSSLKKEAVKNWLASPAVGQEIIAETHVEGHPVLVTHGDKNRQELMKVLEMHGDKLSLHHEPRSFKDYAWPLRSALGFGGQGLQLSASLIKSNRDPGLFLFAVANLTANTMAMVFGAQRTEDHHRLRFLKEQFNTTLGSYAADKSGLPPVDSNRLDLQKEERGRISRREQFGNFLRRNSVTVGEIGLRYIGAFALAFPFTKWKTAGKLLAEGAFKEAYLEGKNANNYVMFTGLSSMAGKTVALASKAEDPYDPKPKTLLDTFREKWTFKLGGWIETVAFSVLSADAFRRAQATGKTPGKFTRDHYSQYLSGTGAGMFTAAYIIRNWAKFGEKDVNMDELYAHITDSLAQMPPDQLPQLMADTAASVKNHFKDKPMDFGKIFTDLMTDLYRYHHIALDNLGTEPEERMAKANAGQPAMAHAVGGKQMLRHRPEAHFAKAEPSARHAEKLMKQASAAAGQPGLSV